MTIVSQRGPRFIAASAAGAAYLFLLGWSAVTTLSNSARRETKVSERERRTERDTPKLEDATASESEVAVGLRALDGAVAKLGERLVDLSQRIKQDDVTVTAKVAEVEGKVASLSEQIGDFAEAEDADEGVPDAPRSLAEAKAYVAEKLGKAPPADSLARVAADIDLWSVKSEDEDGFSKLRLDLAKRLRHQVTKEAAALHEKALAADSAKDAAERHAEAGRILALYPLSDEKEVLDAAKRLAADHVEMTARLEVLRRQRYNSWATERVAAAIEGYNAKKSYWSPKKENPELINSLVENLGEVDPVLLEPAVLELYNYVLDLTKSSISEADKVDLSRRLTDPKIKRRMLGDQ